MNCEFDYCIYNRDFLCILKEDQININQLGMCYGCTIVTIKEHDLNRLKEEQLKDIERRWESG